MSALPIGYVLDIKVHSENFYFFLFDKLIGILKMCMIVDIIFLILDIHEKQHFYDVLLYQHNRTTNPHVCKHVIKVTWTIQTNVISSDPVVSLNTKFYSHCLILVASRNGFKLDFTIKVNWIEGHMEDWLKCQISAIVKYHQNQTEDHSRLRGLCC